MNSAATTQHKDSQVGMGQVALAHAPNLLSAVLGSCIGVALYQPRFHVGAMGHVVLPECQRRPGHPGRFADTAIEYMSRLLIDEGATLTGAVVKLAGGACMFGEADLADGPEVALAGQGTLDALRRAVRAAGLRVVAQHVGGNRGRRITLDCATGELRIKVLGMPLEIL